MASSTYFKSPSSLSTILKEFKEEYNNSVEALVSATPPEEMWYYFSDYLSDEDLKKTRAGETKETAETMRQNGWLKFTEPNYLKALTKAFHVVLTNKIDHFDSQFASTLIDFLLELQKVAVHHVLEASTANGFHTGNFSIGYQLKDHSNTTREGFDELLENLNQCHNCIVLSEGDELKPTSMFCLVSSAHQHKVELFRSKFSNMIVLDCEKLSPSEKKHFYEQYVIAPDPKYKAFSITLLNSLGSGSVKIVNELRATMLRFAEEYQGKIKSASSMQEKLTAITMYIAQCVRYHSLQDGNARSKAILLLNFLLKENGFPIAIVNPNFSGGYSFKQWENEALAGMQRALALAKNHTLPSISTAKLAEYATAEEKKYFEIVTQVDRLCRIVRELKSELSKEEKSTPFRNLALDMQIAIEAFIFSDELALTHLFSAIKMMNKILDLCRQTVPDEKKLAELTEAIQLYIGDSDVDNPLSWTYKEVLMTFQGIDPRPRPAL